MGIIKNHFTETLIDWFSKAKRDLPWRRTKDPYKIWLSEVILQQTRVDQGMPYYHRFVESHPNVHSLAGASEQEILKLWEGLGYYSRARNLHSAAKYVAKELNGNFPNCYEELLKLKGVGPYTAAAIASIAFGEAVPVVDGNVFRFISRHFGVEVDIASASSRKVFENLLEDFIPDDRPGDFNQALMEFGATICRPSPNCEECIFRESCFAFEKNMQSLLPLKIKKLKILEETMNYVVFESHENVLMQVRDQGIWQGLFQFYLLPKSVNQDMLKGYSGRIRYISSPIRHLLTHRKLWVKFIHFEVNDQTQFYSIAKELGLEIFTRKEVLNLPRPKVIVNYLQETVN